MKTDTHVFVGDICLNEGSIKTWLNVMQLFIELKGKKRKNVILKSQEMEKHTNMEF